MSKLTITNNDIGSVIYESGVSRDETLIVAGAGTTLEGTILARKAVDAAVTATPDGGNTGDGTVTSATVIATGDAPVAGAYNLENTVAKAVVGSVTADVGNTGDGTVTELATSATGAPAKVGTYTVECVDAVSNDTLAVGSVTADGGNTGNGTVTELAIDALGAPAKQGTYTVECVEAIVNGGRFKLIDPDGIDMESDILIVAGVGGIIVYTGGGITFKITDGGTDFAVADKFTFPVTGSHGGIFKLTDPDGADILESITLPGTTGGNVVFTGVGITFKVTDGAADFVVGDKFTFPLTGGEFDVFKLVSPNGEILANDLQLTPGDGQATVFVVDGIQFTVTDGATDFIVGDKFALTVVANGKLVVFVIGGVGGAGVPKAVLTYAVVSTGAGDEAIRAMVSGIIRKERLVIAADGDASNVTDAILDQLRDYNIDAKDVQELNIQDNQ